VKDLTQANKECFFAWFNNDDQDVEAGQVFKTQIFPNPLAWFAIEEGEGEGEGEGGAGAGAEVDDE